MIDLLARHDGSRVALLEPATGTTLHYDDLCERASAMAGILKAHLERRLVFLLATNTPDAIVLFQACLAAKIPLCLLEPNPAARLAPLLRAYRPQALLVPPGIEVSIGRRPEPLPESSYQILWNHDDVNTAAHPDLALLLTTSGSTGSPKLVRLTRRNVVANAVSIAEYLGLTPAERSIQGLPMQYSYGLSLINSHLVAGGSVVLTRHSFLWPEFWKDFASTQCTSFAGVPYMYESLHRLRFDPQQYPSLRTMTQAGGGLRRDLITAFYQKAQAASVRFFVMYGQTEATARISYVPAERLGDKIGAIGVPIPRGRLSLAPVEELEARELVYQGPNVMMGYAEDAESLVKGDELQGMLQTGDLATVDDDGFYSVHGRLRRFAKLYGRRVSLEDVERHLETKYRVLVAAVNRNDSLHIFTEPTNAVSAGDIRLNLAAELNVPPNSIHIETVAKMPFNSNGKKDYQSFA